MNSTENYQQQIHYKSVDENINYILKLQGNSFDLVHRFLYLQNEIEQVKIALIYINNLVDQNYLNETILETLSTSFRSLSHSIETEGQLFYKELLSVTNIVESKTFGASLSYFLAGDTLLFIEGINQCIVLGTKKYIDRNIGEPSTNISVKGSKDAFTENIQINISQVRRRIKNPNLWVQSHVVGKDSNTTLAIMYLNGVARPELVEEVNHRIQSMKAENILDSSYVIHFLREKNFSLFPTMLEKERPDIIAANLYEGRVAIFVDGSPFVIIAPTLFIQLFHSVEDYYHKAIIGSFFRIIRLISFFISLFFPALYVVFVTFHSELMPFDLVINISAQRLGLPFPAFLEIFLLGFAFDLLREAGTRMPTKIGSTLSFVGAIIIGQSAVEADLFSPIIVIVVSITAIASLTIPDYELSLSVSILRYVFLLVAAAFGMYGVTLSLVILFAHLTSIRSFGVSYFTPISPASKTGLKDAIIRYPLKKLFSRPFSITRRLDK